MLFVVRISKAISRKKSALRKDLDSKEQWEVMPVNESTDFIFCTAHGGAVNDEVRCAQDLTEILKSYLRVLFRFFFDIVCIKYV